MCHLDEVTSLANSFDRLIDVDSLSWCHLNVRPFWTFSLSTGLNNTCVYIASDNGVSIARAKKLIHIPYAATLIHC
jgi:hypothetical protein